MLSFGPSKIKLLKDPNCHCANGLVRNEDGKDGFKIFYQKYLAQFNVDRLGSKWMSHRGWTWCSKSPKMDGHGLIKTLSQPPLFYRWPSTMIHDRSLWFRRLVTFILAFHVDEIDGPVLTQGRPLWLKTAHFEDPFGYSLCIRVILNIWWKFWNK